MFIIELPVTQQQTEHVSKLVVVIAIAVIELAHNHRVRALGSRVQTLMMVEINWPSSSAWWFKFGSQQVYLFADDREQQSMMSAEARRGRVVRCAIESNL